MISSPTALGAAAPLGGGLAAFRASALSAAKTGITAIPSGRSAITSNSRPWLGAAGLTNHLFDDSPTPAERLKMGAVQKNQSTSSFITAFPSKSLAGYSKLPE